MNSKLIKQRGGLGSKPKTKLKDNITWECRMKIQQFRTEVNVERNWIYRAAGGYESGGT